MYDLRIGSHTSMRGPKYLLTTLDEIIAYDANSFMVYTGPPQNSKRTSVEKLNIEEFKKGLKERNMSPSDGIVHAPYIINPATVATPQKIKFARDFLVLELERVKAIGCEILVLHPGAHVGNGSKIGIEAAAKCMDYALNKVSGVEIAIETMSGKGTEIGVNFHELADIRNQVINNKDRISFCFDTCHVSDSGYDIKKDLGKVLKEFDDVVGLELISCLHINDSKNIVGAKKDRHENIGLGTIGFETLIDIIYHPAFNDKIKILETPWLNNVPIYKQEIEMIREKKFKKISV